MRGGQFRHRLALERYTESRNAARELVKSWSTIGNVWARIEAIAGRNIFTELQTTAQVSHRITIRGRIDIKADDRLIEDTPNGVKYYEIEAVLPSERINVSQQLACRETEQPEDNFIGQ